RVIAIANNVAQECGDFVCIHIRSGDAIYDYADFRKFNTQQFYHVTSAELAMGIIDSIDNSKKIILVGDDLRTLEVIADYYSKDRIATINSFRDPTQMSNLELFFFDVIFMSKATLLYGTHSAVIRLANFIGNQTFFNNYNVFT
ncbi:sugar transferase, partial [Campylobacter coli]|nr:sugar transferase [Campylobacter coli]